MLESLSHIQRSTRLSQDFDDYLERISRSSIHSSSSDIISPHYDYAHQHEAKLQAYQQSQMRQIGYQDLMHNAASGPNQNAYIEPLMHPQITQPPVLLKKKAIEPATNSIIAQNKLIGTLNAMKPINDLSDGNTSFMDEMSSDSDLEDEEKMQYYVAKVPKPRNLNLNAHRQKYLNLNINVNNAYGHERADSNGSTMSGSIVSSVCTPHQREDDDADDDDEKARRFLPIGPTVSQQSKISSLLGSMQSLQSQASVQSVQASIHINIKIFDDKCSSELWMNIRPNDTADHVIAAIIHQYHQWDKPLLGTKVQQYQLRYYDEDEDEIDEDLPALGRNECIPGGVDAIAMLYIGITTTTSGTMTSDHNNNNHDHNNDAIPEVDWDYIEYEIKDEYSKHKTKCILGIACDRIHIVIKSNKTSNHNVNRRRISSNASISGSLMPHFTYVFRLPSSKKRNLHQHRWIDARVLTRQRNCRIKLHETEEKEEAKEEKKQENRDRSIATTFNTFNANRDRSIATDHGNRNNIIPKLGLMLQTSIPNNCVLQNMQQLRLTPLRSGLLLDEYKKKRRTSSAWSFNLFNKKRPRQDSIDNMDKNIDYESWNTYNKDGRYLDKVDKRSPSLKGHYRSGSGSLCSRNQRARSSVASILSSMSIDNDEFTPLTIELCQKISVLKRDNTVFEILFLLDLSSRNTSTPSSVKLINHNNPNRTPSKSKTYRGQRSKRKSNSYSEFEQSSTRSLSIQSDNNNSNNNNKHYFQPFQADNIEIWTDVSQSHSPSRSNSSTNEFIDIGDWKPTNYKKQWNPTQIIPKLEQISAAQNTQKNNMNHLHHPNSLLKQLVNKSKFHVFGNDKYITHTVRYCAKSPEDCSQIVRKIQHLMLLENKTMENN